MPEIYYDADASLDPIRGRRIAVLGFGSQGHAHALTRPGRPARGHAVVEGPVEGDRHRDAHQFGARHLWITVWTPGWAFN